jgi:septin family protein
MLRALFRCYYQGNISRNIGKKQTVSIEEIAKFTLPTETVDINVHLFDTPGYGDHINNQHAIDNVKEYLINAHNHWLQIHGNQLSDKERNQEDTRVHLLFYFIAPHRFKEIDQEFMKQLSGFANIVPVIPKSDTMTLEERAEHLRLIQSTLQRLSEEQIQTMMNTTGGESLPLIFDFEEEKEEEIEHHSSTYFLPPLMKLHVNRVTETPLDSLHHRSPFSDQNEFQSDRTLIENINHATEVAATATTLPATATATVILDDHHEKEEGEDEDVGIAIHATLTTTTTTTTTTALLATTPTAVHHGTTTTSMVESEHDHLYMFHSQQQQQQQQLAQPQQTMTVIMDELPRVPNIFGIVCDNRKYPWGELSLDNENHSDFRRLQRLVFESGKITIMREKTQIISQRFYREQHQKETATFSPRNNNNNNNNNNSNQMASSSSLVSFTTVVAPSTAASTSTTIGNTSAVLTVIGNSSSSCAGHGAAASTDTAAIIANNHNHDNTSNGQSSVFMLMIIFIVIILTLFFYFYFCDSSIKQL